jgi:glucokinase
VDAFKSCLALDIGATNIKYAVVHASVTVADFHMVPTDRDLGPEGLVKQVCDIYRSETAAYGYEMPVGICSAGPLDPVEGRFLVPANLTDGQESWANFPFVNKVKECLNVEVTLENDAAAAALAELWVGKGKLYKDFMVLTLGTGLGTSVVRKGKIVRAAGYLHTEIGHSIINFDEDLADSTARVPGSLESYLGPKFFLEKVSRARGLDTKGEEFIALATAKNPLALEHMELYKKVLVAGMFNFFLAYAPELFIFQGGFSPLIRLMHAELEEELKKKVEGFCRPDRPYPKVEISEMSRTCGVYGAAYGIFSKFGQL